MDAFRRMMQFAGGFRNQAGDAVCGCNHPVATNYNPSATANDGSCEFVYGCTLIMADNYNPAATMEDGSCQGDFDFPTYSGSMGQNITFDSYADYMSTYNQGMYASFGVTYPVDDACTFIADESGFNPPSTGGCTDPMAINFDPNAETDDGSCSYLEGCTDPNALNYNPNVDVDDGSCVYTDDPSGGGIISVEEIDPTGPPTGTNVGDLLDQLADAAGGPTGGASGGSSGGMVTDSGASFEKDPKGKQSKKPKKKFSGFAGRDVEGFFRSTGNPFHK